jgi:hypothetical protein
MRQNIARSNEGYIGLSLFIIIFFEFLIAGGFWQGYKVDRTGKGFRLVDPQALIPKKSLQLQNLRFITIATGSGQEPTGNPNNTFPTPTPTPTLVPVPFNCGYPKQTSFEPNILYNFDPPPNTVVQSGGDIVAWYTDETAFTLGLGANVAMKKNPDHQTLVPSNFGDLTAKDSYGYFLYPALYVTDITNNPNDTSGDFQNKGTAYTPNEICGTWKATKTPNPAKNFFNLPAECGTFPTSPFIPETNIEQNFGTKIIWHVNNLPLQPNHRYRAEFIIHDGDVEQKGFGDIGIACVAIQL